MKYTVDGVPAGKTAAFMPVLNACVSRSAWKWGGAQITGHPGNLAMPSPRPQLPTTGTLTHQAQPSSNSPDQWFPSVYYNRLQNYRPADGTVRWISTNEVPIPAKSIIRIARRAMRPARVGGLRQVTWPPTPQAWQNITPGGVNG